MIKLCIFTCNLWFSIFFFFSLRSTTFWYPSWKSESLSSGWRSWCNCKLNYRMANEISADDKVLNQCHEAYTHFFSSLQQLAMDYFFFFHFKYRFKNIFYTIYAFSFYELISRFKIDLTLLPTTIVIYFTDYERLLHEFIEIIWTFAVNTIFQNIFQMILLHLIYTEFKNC